MDLFPQMSLVGAPTTEESLSADLALHPEKNLLVIYDSNLDFLSRVLAAAGYDNPEEQVHFIKRAVGDSDPLDLSALTRRLRTDRICLFGQDLPSLGLHFTVSPYFPISVAGHTYLVGESVAHISGEKDKGNNKPSRALWGGIKQAFLRDKNTDREQQTD